MVIEIKGEDAGDGEFPDIVGKRHPPPACSNITDHEPGWKNSRTRPYCKHGARTQGYIYTDLLTFKHMHILMSFDFPLLPAEITGLHTFPQTPAPPGECGPVMKQILLNLGDGSSGLPRCLFNMFFLLKWGTIRAKPNNFTYLLFTAFLVERAWENDDPPLDFEVFGRLLGAQRWWKSFSANHINHSHCRGSVLTNGHQHQQQHLQTIMCLGNSL